jgi:hypothetical protein
MPDFGIFRGFNEKLFGDKLYAGQLPTQLGLIGSEDISLLLLDFYPNAAAAYSLRKLRAAYTGSAIKVRRTNLDEMDIGFDSNGELDTTSLLSFTGTGALDNGFVTTWYDQSGNSKNATQTAVASQPQIVSGGSVILDNANPSIQFDGTNDFLGMSLTSNGKLSAIALANIKDFIQIQMLWYNEGTDFYFWNRNTGKIANYYGNFNETNGVVGQRLYEFYNTTTQGIFYENSATTATTNKTLPAGRNNESVFLGSYLGNQQFINANIQELIVYFDFKSNIRTGIETNINDFYSIY